VGLSWDGTNRILYVDDVEVARGTQASLAGSTGNLYVGAGSTMAPATFWKGLIDDVRIYDNTSALFDEMLAHRLGLIPIKTDLDTYSMRETCVCNGAGCPSCSVTFTLSAEGPKMVTSSDLIPQDPKAVPVHDNIPLVKIIKGQKLVLEAKAVLNTGKEHAKWQPTIICGYKNHPVITISDICDGCGMCVEECPREILAVKGKKVEVIGGKLPDCSMCRLCERACVATGIGNESAIRISSEPDRFIFVVEGDGSLPVKEIMKRAIQHIKGQSDELERQVREISGDEKK
jgi:DNA-directed RNA polymerase subunit D